MSFILDALKKLEQKRQQYSVPNLSTVHTPNLHKPGKRPVWPYLLLIALLLNAGILAVWLRPWGPGVQDTNTASTMTYIPDTTASEPASAVPESTVSATSPSEIIENPPLAKIKSNTQSDIINPDQSPELSEEPAESLKADIESEDSGPSIAQPTDGKVTASLELTPSISELASLRQIIKQEQELAGSNISPEDVSRTEPDETIPEKEILELSELPLDIRTEIPDISIFGHIYSSTPSSRLANINGSIVREGETVTGKLKVKEITVNGIIFDYMGLHFRIRAF